VDLTARWVELMRHPDDEVPLGEAALVISGHANPGLDIAAQLRRLDELATRVGTADLAALCRVVFDELGLRGDIDTYDDPLNSYIDRVLDRRRGIPISLSVVLIEIGTRCGLHLEGVGMPGHFLVRDVAAPELLIDAFDGGRRLDPPGCERLLRQVTGTRADLTPEMLATTPRQAILARMLANLDRSFERRTDYRSLLWVTQLRLAIPDLPPGDRVQLAGRLGGLGRFDEAARILEDLAERDGAAELTDRLLAEARSMWARLN
jgi:regulator of sirC expression with transglutaminase-like and TPR domain